MLERVPELRYSLDEWTERMMHWHFSEQTGSPFWLERKNQLPFDPLREIRDFESLKLFGLFDKSTLRSSRARDLLPRGFRGRPFRVVETGGTSGPPCRVVDVTRGDYDIRIYRVMLEARGLAGGDVLAMTPSGPHAYGHFVKRLADSWNGATFFIDFDPRWVKTRLRSSARVDDYLGHLIDQAQMLLHDERPSLLFTTSKLLLALAPALDKPLTEYGVRAACTGGTSCTPEEACYVREQYLSQVQWIDTYGNTLMGHALQADPPSPQDSPSYHLPPPLAVAEIVDPTDPWQSVPRGARGRVRVTTLLEDLFIPNLLERDSAVRTGPHAWFPWEGMARIEIFQEARSDGMIEGVY